METNVHSLYVVISQAKKSMNATLWDAISKRLPLWDSSSYWNRLKFTHPGKQLSLLFTCWQQLRYCIKLTPPPKKKLVNIDAVLMQLLSKVCKNSMRNVVQAFQQKAVLRGVKFCEQQLRYLYSNHISIILQAAQWTIIPSFSYYHKKKRKESGEYFFPIHC